jgi:hypothetical protein
MLDKTTLMIDLETQKAWIIKVIDSCFTEEQLHSARFLITLFLGQLAIKGIPLKDIREVEDSLLSKYIEKEAIIYIAN